MLRDNSTFEKGTSAKEDSEANVRVQVFKAVEYELKNMDALGLVDAKGDTNQLIGFLKGAIKDPVVVISDYVWNHSPTPEEKSIQDPGLDFPFELFIHEFLKNNKKKLFILPLLLKRDHFVGLIIEKSETSLILKYFNPISSGKLPTFNVGEDGEALVKIKEALEKLNSDSSVLSIYSHGLNIEVIFKTMIILSDEQQINGIDCAYIVGATLAEIAENKPLSIQKFNPNNLSLYAKSIARARAYFYDAKIMGISVKNIRNQFLSRLGRALSCNQEYASKIRDYVKTVEDKCGLNSRMLAIVRMLAFKIEVNDLKEVEGTFLDDKVINFLIKNKELNEIKWEEIRRFCEMLLEPYFPEYGDVIFKLNSSVGKFALEATISKNENMENSEEWLQKQTSYQKSMESKDNISPVLTLGDGNCAFNAFALGLCDVVLAGKINNKNLYFALQSGLGLKKATIESFKEWLEKNTNSYIRQKTLQGILRHFAVNFIEENYNNIYKNVYEELLWDAYQKKDIPNGEDTFIVHKHMSEKFKENGLSKADLLAWWNLIGKKTYFDNIRQTAKDASESEKWGGEPEIDALATSLGINIWWEKGTGKRYLGIGSGIIQGLSSEEIMLLRDLKVGESVGTLFRLNFFDNTEELEEHLKPLPHSIQSNLLQFIEDIDEKQINLPDNIGGLPVDSNLKDLLRKRGILNDNNRFVNDEEGNLEKDRIKRKIIGITDNTLKEKLIKEFKPKELAFGIRNNGFHWTYLKYGSISPVNSKETKNLGNSLQKLSIDSAYLPQNLDYAMAHEFIEDKSETFTYPSSEEEDISTTINPFIGIDRLPLGSIKFNKNNQESLLGKGAFGRVYKGEWNKRLVALKEIDIQRAQVSLGLSEEEVKEALQWEVARLSTVNHPNLVQFYGLYVEEGKPYLVIEYCEGGDLRSVLNKTHPNWSKRWQWALEISQGLAYLHHQGMLHRDLKAENILIDSHGRARLADLGVAQVDVLLQKEEAKVVFKGLQDRVFASPEALQDAQISTSETDIYALGIVFWQLLNQGKKPYTPRYSSGSINEQKLLVQMQTGQREAIPEDCPAEFKKLILSCWAFEASKRPKIETILKRLNTLSLNSHPEPHWMALCQQTDILIHPKRAEVLNYVPSLVTEHRVQEDLDTYWRYLETKNVDKEESSNSDLEKSPLIKIGNPPLELKRIFNEFLASSQSSTLLLLGESGLGKTLSTYQLASELLSQWWQYLAQLNKEDMPYFPIFIRPSLNRWAYSELKDGFEQALKSCAKEIPLSPLKEGRFLIIIDGYDECEANEKPSNLSEVLGIKDLPNVKLLVTCRPNTVEPKNLLKHFALNGNLTVRYFLPFNVTQLLGYLNQILHWESATYRFYQEKLQQSHSLRVVLRNPFVASLFVQSWETVKKKDFNQLNRWQVFGYFIEHWIYTCNSLLSPTVQETLTVHCKSETLLERLLESFNIFSAEIAFNGFQKEAIIFDKKPQEISTLSKITKTWLDLKEQIKKDSQKIFEDRRGLLTQSGQRRALLNEEDYLKIMEWRLQQFEASCPLKNKEALCEFSHKSFFEYFVAKRIVLLREKDHHSIVEEALELLDTRLIQTEPEAVVFLIEGWQEAKTRHLIDPLFEILEHSKKEEFNQVKASANAATVLNIGRVSFSGRDLSGIRIPKTDLSYGIFDHTNFRNANLRGSNLQGGWFRCADFTGANLTGVEFGESPALIHESEVRSVAYSSDGQWLAVATGNDIVIWDIQLEKRQQILKGHTNSVNSVAISSDGQTIASGSNDQTVKLWDKSGKLIRTLEGHTTSVNSITISSDGQIIVSGSDDCTIKVWDKSGKLIRILNHNVRVKCVAISSDGQTIVSGSDDQTVKLWDKSGKLIRILNHNVRVKCVAISSDGQTIVSGGYDKTVKVWDKSGKLIHTLEGHTNFVNSVAISPAGQTIVSGSDDQTVKLWDKSGKLIRILRHTDSVNSVAISPDGQTIVSGSRDKKMKLWNKSSGFIRTLEGHTNSVNSVAISLDGKTIVSGSHDYTIKVWDENGTFIRTLDGHTDSVNSVAISPDGQTIVSGSRDKKMKLWNKSIGLIRTLEGHTEQVNSVAVSPDGLTVLSGKSKDSDRGGYDWACNWSGVGSTVEVWDRSGKFLHSLTGPHYVRGISIGDFDGWMSFWCNNPTLECVRSFSVSVNSITMSADGQIIISGSDDYTIKVWHKSGTFIRILKHDREVKCVAISPNREIIVSGSSNSIKLWELKTGTLIRTLKGHTYSVNSVAISSDGQTIASGSKDNTVKFWDMASGKMLASLSSGYLGTINSVTWHNNILVTGSSDNSVKCWRVERKPDSHLSCTLLWNSEISLYLYVEDCQVNKALLSLINTRLLKQNGAIGYPCATAHDHPNWNILHLAAANNNLAQLQEITFLDELTSEGETALHIAVRYEAIETIEYLLKQGANPWLRNAQGQCPGNLANDLGQKGLLAYLPMEDKEHPEQTPLHLAIENGYERVVAYLLKQRDLKKFKCDINAPNHRDETPLLLATTKKNIQIIMLLLEKGTEPNGKNKVGETAAHVAVRDNQLEILKLLQAHGADLLVKDTQGNALLHYAVAANQVKALEWLLEEGIPIDLPNESQLTPLALAAQNTRKEAIEFLLKKGANFDAIIELRLKKGNTLLHWAAQESYLEILEMLLKTKINIEIKNDNGETAAHLAAYRDRLEVLKRLKIHGANLLTKDNQGNTPLHHAALNNNTDTMRWLLQQGVPIDSVNEVGETPLQLAAKSPGNGLLLLLEQGANLNAISELKLEERHVLWFWAAEKGFLKILQALLKTNIKLEIKNDDGRTAVHLAARYSRFEALKLFKSYGADLLTKDNKSWTSLHHAVAGQVEVVKWILDQGVPVDILGKNDRTPLHKVATSYYSKKEMIELLLQKGANPKALDKNGKTPAQLARDKNKEEIAKLIEQNVEQLKLLSSTNEKSEEKLATLTKEVETLSLTSQSTDNNTSTLIFSKSQQSFKGDENKVQVTIETSLQQTKEQKVKSPAFSTYNQGDFMNS